MNEQLQIQKLTEKIENLKATETKLTKGNKWYSLIQDIYIKNVD